MRNRRVAPFVAFGVGSILVLASCGYGVTGVADEITPISAVLHGTVGNTVAGSTTFHFDYGTTDAYGSVANGSEYFTTARSVEDYLPIGGLTDETTYHYRLCVNDRDGNGTCGDDATFTTPAGDYVQGDGVVGSIYLNDPFPFTIVIGGSMAASSAPDGSNPAGDGWVRPTTTYPPVVSDRGTVTCLKVVGNRAAIGLSVPAVTPAPFHYDVVFIEDNGPTGDRWDAAPMSAPGTTCPTPTDADFDGYWFSTSGPAVNYGSTLSSGDFVVHDHP